MVGSRRSSRALALLAAGLLGARVAHAAPPESDDPRARADAEFAEGKALMNAGHTSAACERFARSEELDPRLGRLLNLAFCHEQEGKVASAWREFTDATSLAGQRGQAERASFAREHASAVAKQLSFVLFEPPPNATAMHVDGVPLARESWSTPIPLDPGDHTVVASAPGKRTLRLTIAVPAVPGTRVVPLALLEDEGAPAAAPPAAPEPAPAAPPAAVSPVPARNAQPGRVDLMPAYAASGVAVVGVAVGAGFVLDALSKKGAADPHCPDKQCDATGSALISEARSSAALATVGFGVAGVGALVATWLFVRPPGGSSPARTTAWAAPDLDAHSAGLRVGGRW